MIGYMSKRRIHLCARLLRMDGKKAYKRVFENFRRTKTDLKRFREMKIDLAAMGVTEENSEQKQN